MKNVEYKESLTLDEILTLASKVQEWRQKKRKIYGPLFTESQYCYTCANVYVGSVDDKVSVEIAEDGSINFPKDSIRIRVYGKKILFADASSRGDIRIKEFYSTLQQHYDKDALKRTSLLRHIKKLISASKERKKK